MVPRPEMNWHQETTASMGSRTRTIPGQPALWRGRNCAGMWRCISTDCPGVRQRFKAIAVNVLLERGKPPPHNRPLLGAGIGLFRIRAKWRRCPDASRTTSDPLAEGRICRGPSAVGKAVLLAVARRWSRRLSSHSNSLKREWAHVARSPHSLSALSPPTSQSSLRRLGHSSQNLRVRAEH